MHNQLGFQPNLMRIAASAVVLLCSVTAQANIGEAFGFGSRTAALGGAGVAFGYGGFAAYHNPAGLPFLGKERLIVEIGVLSMTPSLTPIKNVIVENTYTSDKITYGDVDTDYRSTLGTQLGLVYRVLPETLNLTLGIAAFLPMAQIAYMDTGETFVPEYVLYRSRTQRPQVEFGAGASVGRGIHVGVGLHLAFALTSNASAFMQTDAAKPSTMRFTSSLKPRVAPYFGVLFTPLDPDAEPGTSAKFSLGTVLRLPVSSPNTLFLKSGARAFGSFAALDFNFNAASALFYDPLTLELGGSFQTSDTMRTYLQLDYQAWGKFEAPALSIQEPTIESCTNTGTGSACGVIISGGINPAVEYNNILIPRIGEELTFGTTTLRLGYSYRPSILKNVPTGAGNYLDPPKHEITAGVGLKFAHFLNFETPCQLDIHGAFQQLLTQHIDKAPGDENGSGSGDLKIGAPGYEAGGKIFGGGLSLTLAF